VNFHAVSSKFNNFDEVHFFIEHIPKLTIFDTHNMQTLNIIHSSINYCSCSGSYLIFVPNCITRSDENHAHTVLNFLNFTSNLLMLFFIQPLSRNCYKLSSVVTFTFIQIWIKILSSLLNSTMLTSSVTRNFQNLRYFRSVLFERQKVDKKSKSTRKLKHANSILEYFEYFCQMSSKSIFIILSYTVSKFVHFF